MGWHVKFVICVQLAYVSVCLTREMSVVREWTSLDKLLLVRNGQEIRSILPSEIKSWLVYKDRMFVTLLDGWGDNYLAYLDLTDNSTSPLLRPYPSLKHVKPLDYKTGKVRVDRCNRLWATTVINVDSIIAFDLKTDEILKFTILLHPIYSLDMIFDDFDCDNEYVYISTTDGVWTYSWAEGDLWRHNISDNMTSMVLAPNSIVYYNVRFEPTVYYMPTTHLRDKSNKTVDIRELGRSRKLNVNLASSALDAKNDVLYYFNDDNKTVIHAVPCWTSERCSSNCQDEIVGSIDSIYELRYITLDENGYLWVVTSKSSFEDGEINFRLLSVPVKRTCLESNANDTTNTSTDVESNAEDTTNTSTDVEPNAEDTTNTSTDVESNAEDTTNTSTDVESNAEDTTNTSTDVESNAEDTTNTSTDVESNAEDTTNTSTDVESNAEDTTNTSTDVESNAEDTTNTSTDVESNAEDTTNTSTDVESNAEDTTNTSTDVESNAEDTTNTSTDVEPNAKDTTNINESTTAASSTTEQTSTLGSVHKNTTVNIADTTAGTPNSNITQAVGGTKYMPYLLFSFTNTTIFNFNLSNFTIRY